MAWRIRPGADLVWRSWDEDEFLVFDAASGDTHLLNRVTATVFEILGREPLDDKGIGRELSRCLDIDPAVVEPHLARLLSHLARLGLVESTP